MKFFDRMFSSLKRDPIPDYDTYPRRHNLDEWMEAKFSYYKKKHPEYVHNLFSPHSGDYIPTSIHVGFSFDEEAKAKYHEFRKKHIDYASIAMERNSHNGIATRVSVSRVYGHPDDFKHLDY